MTDAVQKKKERPRIDKITNIFHSMSTADNGTINDDKDATDDNATASMTLPPSARKILKQRRKKQASIMPGKCIYFQLKLHSLKLYSTDDI